MIRRQSGALSDPCADITEALCVGLEYEHSCRGGQRCNKAEHFVRLPTRVLNCFRFLVGQFRP
jgi:hypothetical protein